MISVIGTAASFLSRSDAINLQLDYSINTASDHREGQQKLLPSNTPHTIPDL